MLWGVGGVSDFPEKKRYEGTRFNVISRAIQVLLNALGVSDFPGKKRYEGTRFNVFSVTRGWVGVQYPGKKRYVTLQWPLTRLSSRHLVTLKLKFSQCSSIHTNYIIPHCTTLQYNHNI